MNLYQFFRPLIFQLDPETAHDLAIKFLKFCPRAATIFCHQTDYENLRTKLWGLDFTSPIGLAAGFDKNAEVAKTLEKFGFGFLECGTVTLLPQPGNPKPRLFRLVEDCAVINRLGFNNLGAEVFEKNLPQISVPLGINIGKNKDTQDVLSDYLPLLEKFYQKASYITVNISSPNTKNLRDLQNEDHLDLFLSEIIKKKNELKCLVPILLKVAPDLDESQQEKIAATVIKNKIDGMIISNTTIDRALNLRSHNATQTGGLSGVPLFHKSNEVLRNFYKFTEGKIPLIGVGGVSSAADVYEKIKCGASLVQLYTTFIYEGFGLVERIKKELSEMVKKDGLKNISEAVGTK
ncbi:MAG: quinone-dependent dihydroorotate dehydrogenase [Alphaproteobacteria bacterium]|nr:quinone-dependent dihydroorotate dehydrogenase [Alphaproteobacteria bacterium]